MPAFVRISTLAWRRCIPKCRLNAGVFGQCHCSRPRVAERTLSCPSRRRLPAQTQLPSHHLSSRRKDIKPTPDTIYALSTSAGRAAIAVVRISGPSCLDIYGALCPERPFPIPRVATLRKLRDPQDPSRTIDSGALVLYFPSPSTVTGEDILELHCHGGPAIVRAVLEAIPRCSNMGRSRRKSAEYSHIRPADAGEFTLRSFWNGRIDLLEAEALGEALTAETEMQRVLALESQSASGGLVERYEKWREILLYARGEMEALIDFSEDQHFDESPRELVGSVVEQVRGLKTLIERHVHNARKGELLRNGISVALLGAPNAGKSSLLNLIVGREAAIVSSEAGTTRDIVDVSVDLGGWLVRLGDMAGLRGQSPGHRDDGLLEMNQALRQKERDTLGLSGNEQRPPTQPIGAVEREGIRRAHARALESDVVIVLLPIQLLSDGQPVIDLDPELVDAIRRCHDAGKQLLYVLNKTDLLPHHQVSDYVEALKKKINNHFRHILTLPTNTNIVPVSCINAAIASTSLDPDPGNLQTLIQTLTALFASMTTANSDSNLTSLPGLPTSPQLNQDSYWHASLSISHRQAQYLLECLDHLSSFLAIASPSTTADTLSHSHHIHSEYEERDNNESDDNVDMVLTAEHLRHAATCLAKITGRGEGGDVEEVLGVVFEKFCVGK